MQDGFVTLQPLSPSFSVGQRLQIADGPLSGFQAVFQREITGSQRIAILLNAVAFQTTVIIDRSLVVAC